MTAIRNAVSRTSSTRPASVARSVTKRRDKPYKTERSRVLAKKRKLNLHTTYTNPPPGFQFLPVGTPELADRCKELSRQKGLPVNVVNAKPVSKNAVDPAKVSHHIHRIGYHFRSDVVDEACQQLGYTLSRGKFIREHDLKEQNDQSKLAAAMARHGLKSIQPLRQETDEQVRAAIKELFPRIPEEDLKAILKHAWEEGSHRVGTNSTMELPRRVQLATIARIRHTYTDYDRLLKAFDWKDARSLVEPVCLAKLIEWRGENEEEDDNELEEIVRETIVIDDDDDDDSTEPGSETYDEDSTVEDGGYVSDTSIEISHQPAGDADLGAESSDERSRRFFDRQRQPPRSHQRYREIRQKIGLVQQQRRDGVAMEYAREPEIIRVHVPVYGNSLIENNGQLRTPPMFVGSEGIRGGDPSALTVSRTHSRPTPTQGLPPVGAYSEQPGFIPRPRSSQIHSRAADPAGSPHDWPIESIEPHDHFRRMAISSANAQQGDQYRSMTRSRPVTPDGGHSGKRRRVEYPGQVADERSWAQPSVPNGRPLVSHSVAGPGSGSASPRWPLASPQRLDGVIDLTGSPMSGRVANTRQAAYPLSSFDAASGRSAMIEPVNSRPHRHMTEARLADAPYDPRNPILPVEYRVGHDRDDVHRREENHRRGFVDAQIAPIQYVPLQQPSSSTAQSRSGPGSFSYARQHQQPFAYPPSHRSVPTPQPVHGAPAIVQQIPRQSIHHPQNHRSPPAGAVVSVSSGAQLAHLPGYPAPLQPIPQPQYYSSR